MPNFLPSRQTLLKTAGFAGGAYLTHTFLRDRLEEAKEKVEEDAKAKESLRRRFTQTAHTTSYTILALLPELASQIMEEMDVESVTRELQALGRTRGATQAVPVAVEASRDVEVRGAAAQGSAQVGSAATDHVGIVPDASPSMASSYASIPAPNLDPSASASASPLPSDGESIVNVQAPTPSPPSHTPQETQEGAAEGGKEERRTGASSPTPSGSEMSASLVSLPSVASVASGGLASPEPAESLLSSTTSMVSQVAPNVPEGSPARTKAELWNEVKILTLTRTLTTLYTLTFLSLLTTLQLSILSRHKYLASVYAEEREERHREKVAARFDISSMIARGVWEGVKGTVGGALGLGGEDNALSGGMEGMLEKLLAGGMDLEAGDVDSDEEFDEDEDEDEDGLFFGRESTGFPFTHSSTPLAPRKPKKGIRRGKISEETENKYLTLSYHLLHIGWREVGERVRRGVESGVEGISLKTKLSPTDLHTLLLDVRRRVEWEVTFEGRERRVDFMSSLLPSTEEMIHHVLVQGGYIPPHTQLPEIKVTTSTADHYKLNPEDPSSSQRGFPGSSRHGETDGTEDSSQLSASREWDPRSPCDMRSPHDPQLDFDPAIPSSSSSLSPSSRPPATSPIPPTLHGKPSTSRLEPYPHITNDLAFLDLLSETRATMASPDFGVVLEALLERGMEVLRAGLEKHVFVESSTAGDGEEVRIRLAGLLPGLARWSSLALTGMPNEFVDNILQTYDIRALSAIVWARFEGEVEYY